MRSRFAYAFDVIVCQSEFEALVLEASQIKACPSTARSMIFQPEALLTSPTSAPLFASNVAAIRSLSNEIVPAAAKSGVHERIVQI